MGWKSKRLRDKASKLALAGKCKDAAEAYRELARIEPDEPRWPHKRGDMLRRLRQDTAAISAYESAVDAYARMGFLARAVAMAKVILSIDESRTDILARVDPTAAQELRKKTASGLYDARSLLEQAEALDATAVSAAVESAAVESAAAEPAGAEPAAKDSAASTETATPDAAEELAAEPTENESAPSTHATAQQTETQRKRTTSSVFEAAVPLTLQAEEEDVIVFDDAEVTNLTLSDQELSDEEEERRIHSDSLDPLALAALPAMPLFADLPTEAFHGLVSNAELLEVSAGTVIIEENSAADALYVLTEGAAKVVSTRLDRPMLLSEGEVFGESCLVESGARQANVVAHTDLSALRIGKDTLDALCTVHPQLRDVLLELLTRRLVSNLMTTSPIFRDLPKELQRSLATSFELRTAQAGTTLIVRNKRADALYLLLSGALELVDSQAGRAQILLPGALVGTYSLVRKTGSLHDVSVKTSSILLRLSATRFRMAIIESQTAVDHLRTLSLVPPDPRNPAMHT